MIELLTNAEMAQADRCAIAAGTPGIELMERAGRAVADAVCLRHPLGSRVCVVAGPGNNGGDGFVAARVLSERGYRVRLMLVGDVAKLKGDAAEAARRWSGPVEPAVPAALSGATVIIDALFGAGLDRPVEGLARAMIEAINASGVPVVAVDLPSGINGDNGAVMGAAVRATETVTFFRKKIGHLLLPGRLYCGAVRVADIGIDAAVLEKIRPRTFVNDPQLWRAAFPLPQADSHKYSRGHAVVVSGGLASTGAARLAARGALRAGAGLVTIASPREALAVHAATNLAIMVRPVDGAQELAQFLADPRRNAVVLGPGGGVGEAMRAMVFTALRGKRAVVLDADALTSFAGESGCMQLRQAVLARRDQWGLPENEQAKGQALVLTPHEGEFARVFGGLEGVKSARSKLERAVHVAQEFHVCLLLKGADTVIAAPAADTWRAAINANAPPWLATAGSGDVLAGIIAALLAQGMPAFEAACAGAWLHGEVATAVGPGLISEDLPEALPQVYRRLLAADVPP